MNMTRTGLVYDEIYLKHDTGSYHPETAQRLIAIIEFLKTAKIFDKLLLIKPTAAPKKIIGLCHESDYIERFENAVRRSLPFLDTPDCPLCPFTFEVACYAVGGLLKGIDAVMENRIKNCFCAVRPPGHHAERSQAMGFCYFNNVAIAAKYLQKEHGLERIVIVDWDVHHGNGTQHFFEEDPTVFYISFHQDPATCYPGTGWTSETGFGKGKGYTLNFPMPLDTGNEAYLNAMERVEEIMEQFKPQFVLISAGFDAHIADPLAHIKLTQRGYKELTRRIKKISEEYAEGRLVSVLEGGYNQKALEESLKIHIQVLMEG